VSRDDFAPISGMVLPRFAGIATFMRLPHLSPAEAAGRAEVGLFGIPFDGATTNRPGARHGPRAVRDQSSLMRLVNGATGVAPYDLARVCDLGDVDVNPIDIADTMGRIERFVAEIVAGGIVPVAVGGDHLVSYPVLRVLGRRRPVGMVHVDAHGDTGDTYFGGQRLTHGTGFRRAIEDGVLDPRRTVQIGIRGSRYDADEYGWAVSQGVRIVDMEEVDRTGLDAVLAEAGRAVGSGPTYHCFDVAAPDPAFVPGTGTPEMGGLTSREALRLMRGLRGIDFVGADGVEVSPPLDPTGMTAMVGATVLFEALCLVAEALAARRGVERAA
jgi:guanidinopropionase